MTITLTLDAQANLDYAAAKTGRTAESLATDAVAMAFAPYAEARERESLKAFKVAFDSAEPKATKEQIVAAVVAEKAAG